MNRDRLCRGVGLFLVVLLVAGSVQAVGVWGVQMKVAQPDGTRIEVKVWGDEFYRVYETLDGYVIVQAAGGEWQYAKLSADGTALEPTGKRVGAVDPKTLGLPKHQRIEESVRRALIAAKRLLREQRNQERLAAISAELGLRDSDRRDRPPEWTTTGTRKGLTLLIKFSDSTETETAITRQQVDDYCNKASYTDFDNTMSVKDYFYEVSNGTLTYENAVADWYTAQNTKAYYDGKSDGPTELLQEALNYLENTVGFDFSTLDGNGDGTIDGINGFYAGEYGSNNLWPHQASVEFTADGVSAYFYQVTGMGSSLSVTTFCHENGHMLCDFPDLYDRDNDSNGVGHWCLMSYSKSEKKPQWISAYLRYKAGWLTPTTLTASTNQTFTLENKPGQALLYANTADSKEYFLLENRNTSGVDIDLPGSGLAIWHVDENVDGNDAQQRTAQSHFECSLVQADGQWELEGMGNDGDAGDLFSASGVASFSDSTTPDAKWWNGTASGLSISNISAAGTSMTLDVGSGGGTTSPTATISATDSSAAEAGPDTGTFTVSLSAAATSDVTVSYTVSGTATSGSDYTALSGTVTVTSGQSSATVTVTPVDDSEEESSETVVLTLASGTGYTVGSTASDTVTITDNDTATTYTLAGTITSGGSGVSGAWVDLWTSAGAWVKNTQAASDGSYSFTGVSAGDYTVRGYDPNNGNAATDYGSTVTVSSSNVTGVDIAFASSYSLSGAITSGGSGVSGAWVDLWTSTGSWVKNTQTASDGSYSFTGLSAGSYTVRGYDPSNGNAATDYASTVTISSSSATGIDIAFASSYSLSGTITSGGSGVSGAWVDLWTSTGSWVKNTQTASDGSYSFSGLSTGSYTVRGYDPSNGNAATDYASTVTISSSSATGIDIAFSSTHTVSGTVTTDGAAASGVWLDIFTSAGTWKGNAQTASDGTYSLGPVAAGTYNVYAYEPGTMTKTAYASNPLTVAAAATGIDFAFSSTTYSISGTVSSGGAGVASVWLDLWTSSGAWVKNTQTASDGTYSFNGISAGEYLVSAYNPAANNARTDYASVLVLSDVSQTGVDIDFSSTYTVSGTVTQGGSAASGLWLDIFCTDSGTWKGNAQTGSDGTYSLGPVADGTYNVYVYAPTKTAYGSNPVAVSGQNVTGIDLSLP